MSVKPAQSPERLQGRLTGRLSEIVAEIWALRPSLDGNQTATVAAAIEALAREIDILPTATRQQQSQPPPPAGGPHVPIADSKPTITVTVPPANGIARVGDAAQAAQVETAIENFDLGGTDDEF